MIEIGWTEIIISIISILGLDTGVIVIIVKFFLDRQAKAEAKKTNSESKKVDSETEKEAISNALEAFNFYEKMQTIIDEAVKKATAPMQIELENTSIKVQDLTTELKRFGCYRGALDNEPDCELRVRQAPDNLKPLAPPIGMPQHPVYNQES